jgi:hypothetical protein
MTDKKEQELESQVVSLKEAALINGVLRQAIHVVIDKKRLKATKDPKSGRLLITLAGLEEYRRTKYSRAFSRRDGRLVFDKEKGLYSVAQASELISITPWDLYTIASKKGELKSSRNGAAYVLHIDDIKAYQKTQIPKIIKFLTFPPLLWLQ